MAMNAPEDLPIYPIRTAAALTGVPARRLRGWEVEYRLIHPGRSKGGHRLYSIREIRLLQQIRHLIEDEGMSPQGIRAWLESHPELSVSAGPRSPA